MRRIIVPAWALQCIAFAFAWYAGPIAIGQCLPQERQRLHTPAAQNGDSIGQSISADGDYVIIGAPGEDIPFTNAGAAYVFRRDDRGTSADAQDDRWGLQARLQSGDVAWGDKFGTSVAIHGDFAIVGAPFDDPWGEASGTAYIFRRQDGGTAGDPSDDTWVEVTQLQPANPGGNDRFGMVVAISDRDALVTSPNEWYPYSYDGVVYAFQRNENNTPDNPDDDTWQQTQRIIPSGIFFDAGFGASLSLRGDRFVAGAPDWELSSYDKTGKAFVYRRQGSTWALERNLMSPNGYAAGGYGRSVALRDSWILITEEFLERVYVYRLDDGGTSDDLTDDQWIQHYTLSLGTVFGADRSFGTAAAMSDESFVIGAPWDDPACPNFIGCNSGTAMAFFRDHGGTPTYLPDDLWYPSKTLRPSGAAMGDYFGSALAITGESVFVGAPQEFATPPGKGAVTAFHLTADCNANGIPDSLDILQGTSGDANHNQFPDECEIDCNSNGTNDFCEIATAVAPDCNANWYPDSCDLAAHSSVDTLPATGDGIPDECQLDCNANANPDSADIVSGVSLDCTSNGIPDECEADCNANGVTDVCEVADGSAVDCNHNGVPDSCDLATGASPDVVPPVGNGIPDECDVNCNQNSYPDDIDIRSGTSPDCNKDLVPDECQYPPGFDTPFILNGNASADGAVSDAAPDIVHDGHGNWVALWNTRDQNANLQNNDWDLAISTSQDDGVTWSAPRPFNTWSTGEVFEDGVGSLATDGKGLWLVAWSTAYTGGGPASADTDLWQTRSLDNGQTWSTPVRVNSDWAGDGYDDDWAAQLVTDKKGTWLLVWTRGSSGSEKSYWSRSTNDGLTWAAPQLIPGADRGRGPKLATDGDGNWVCTWSTFLYSVPSGEWDVRFSRSTDNGVSWSGGTALNISFFFDTGHDVNPSIATNGKGTYLIVWESTENLGGQIGPDQDILFSRSTNDGVSWSAPQMLNTNAATDSGRDESPHLVTDGRGTWVVMWSSNDTLGGTIDGEYDVLIAVSQDDGATWSDPRPLSSEVHSLGGAYGGELLSDGKLGWMAAYWSRVEFDGAGPDLDLHAHRFFIPVLPDCDCNGFRDELDIAAGGQADVNTNGVPDRCEFDCDGNHTPDVFQVAAQPHLDNDGDGIIDQCSRKMNRHITFVPVNTLQPSAYRVEKVKGWGTRGFIGWVDSPDADGKAGITPNQPPLRLWTEPLVTVGDCEIVPASIYRLGVTFDGHTTDNFMATSTVHSPLGKYWGDIVGSLTAGTWGPPDGLSNINDLLAILQAAAGLESAPTVPMADLLAVSTSDPCLNGVVNTADLFAGVRAARGEPYPFMVEAGFCPPCP